MTVVLVVEDESFLRAMAVELAEEAGFAVVEAANADEAIAILERRNDIRIVFTDIDMPNGSMDGLKLAAAVRDRWPPVHIMVVSGHYAASQEELPAGSLFFPKPYQRDAVVAAMRDFARPV